MTGPAAPLSPDDVVVIASIDPSRPALVLGRRDCPPSLGRDAGVPSGEVVQRVLQGLGIAGQLLEAGGVASGRWVKLTSDSAAQFRLHGAVPDANGQLMGIVRGAAGQFSHIARFELINGMAFGVSGLVGGLAVQQMLKSIEQDLTALTERVDVLVEGSRIEMEAQLASALDVISRVERRASDRARVSVDDWTSLAVVEPVVKSAYHQTVRWLDPLRDLLIDEDTTIAAQVQRLRRNLQSHDIGFWLRMYAYAELAMKRWEVLYLIYETDMAPERVHDETGVVLARARERHAELLHLHNLIAIYLDRGPEAGSWLERLNFLNRYALQELRFHLAVTANGYAEALDAVEIDVPEYSLQDLRNRQQPIIDSEALRSGIDRAARQALDVGATAANAGWRGIRGGLEAIRRQVP